MSQILMKIRQVWAYLNAQGVSTSSPFVRELSAIVDFVFGDNVFPKNDDEDSMFVYMREATKHMTKAYEEYNKPNCQVFLPYEHYVRFIEACILCKVRMPNGNVVIVESENEYHSRRTANPLATSGETRGNKLENLLATLKQIVDELEKLNQQEK